MTVNNIVRRTWMVTTKTKTTKLGRSKLIKEMNPFHKAYWSFPSTTIKDLGRVILNLDIV